MQSLVNLKPMDVQQSENDPIESLRNLGPKSGQRLKGVGIHTIVTFVASDL